MKREWLPVLAPLADYERQADDLLAAFRSGSQEAIEIFHQTHPRFLDPVVTWKPLEISNEEIGAATLDQADARLALARGYSFRDWEALATHVAAVLEPGSAVQRYELAVEAAITGDLAGLEAMLARDPDLVRARSARVTCHDPPTHRATVLHYLGANGVEGYRQRSPANAVAIARRLLEAGAEADALAGMYGSECATLSMLVSSTPPADAGVQVPLVHVLVDFGASVEGVGGPNWASPVSTALAFGFVDAARALVERGARVDSVVKAAGLDRRDDVERLLPTASPAERHAALAVAAQLGNVDAVSRLLDAGEDPNRLNPPGFHSHATPLHHAALAGHLATVTLLIERGARLDIRDRLWQGTPLDWANHNGKREAALLLERAARR